MDITENQYFSIVLRKTIIGFILTFCFSVQYSFAQCPETNSYCKHANHWIFGDSSYLEFVDTGIVVRKKRYSSYEASGSYIDRSGKLIYYGNSEYIFKPNGDTLFKNGFGNSSTSQGMYFLESDNPQNLYLLTGDNISPDYSSRLYLRKFNISSSNVVDDKVLVYPSTELVAVVNHQNKKYKWIGTHEARSNRIFFFLLKPDNLMCCPVIEQGEIDFGAKRIGYLVGFGQMKFSPNGKYFAFNSNESLELSYFDSEYAKLDSSEYYGMGGYGVEFSPNCRNVFTSRGHGVKIQPLDSFPPKSNWNVIRTITINRNESLGALQLAPDGKIYAATLDNSYLGNIENPDAHKDSVIYTTKGLFLHPESTSQRGLPSFNASIFYTPSVDFSYEFNCNTREYTFVPEDTFLNKSTRWEILNLRTNKKENVGGFTLKHKFSEPVVTEEKYKVSYILFSNGHRDTASKIITVRPQINQDFLGKDTFYCEGEPLTLRTPKNLHCIHWMGEEPNMDTTIGPYVDYAHFHKDSTIVDSTGIYYVRITDKNFCSYNDTIEVGVRPKPTKPIISNNTGELASDIEEDSYIWYFNDSFHISTKSRSIKAHDNGYFQVKLVNEYGCESELSDSFLVDWVSIEDINLDNNIKVFPNPTRKRVNVVFPGAKEFQVTIVDMFGKTIYWNLVLGSKHRIDLSTIKAGPYLITIQDPKTGLTMYQIIQVIE